MSSDSPPGDFKKSRASRWRRWGTPALILLLGFAFFASDEGRSAKLRKFTNQAIDDMRKVNPFFVARTFFSRLEYCKTAWNFRCRAPEVEVPSQTKSNPCGPGDVPPRRRTLFPPRDDLSAPPGPLQFFWGLPDAVTCTAGKVAEGGLVAIVTAMFSLLIGITLMAVINTQLKWDSGIGTVWGFIVGVPITGGIFAWLFIQLVIRVFILFGAYLTVVAYLAIPLTIIKYLLDAREFLKLGRRVIVAER